MQDYQALAADTISAGSDEEEKVLQQKTNRAARVYWSIADLCLVFCFCFFFSFLSLEGIGSQSSGPGMPPYCTDKKGMVVFSIFV